MAGRQNLHQGFDGFVSMKHERTIYCAREYRHRAGARAGGASQAGRAALPLGPTTRIDTFLIIFSKKPEHRPANVEDIYVEPSRRRSPAGGGGQYPPGPRRGQPGGLQGSTTPKIAYMDWQIGSSPKGLEKCGELRTSSSSSRRRSWWRPSARRASTSTEPRRRRRPEGPLDHAVGREALDDEAIRLEDLMPTILALADLGSQVAGDRRGRSEPATPRRRGLSGRPTSGPPSW